MSSLPLLSKSRRKCFHHLPLLLVKKWPPTLYPLISCWGYTVMCINILPKICPFLFPVSYFLLPPAFFFLPWPFSFLPQAFFFYRGNFSFAETYFSFFAVTNFFFAASIFFCREQKKKSFAVKLVCHRSHMTSDVKFSYMLFLLIYTTLQKLYSTK